MLKETLSILLLSILLVDLCRAEERDKSEAFYADWKYGETWDATANPKCFTLQQSPIDLISSKATKGESDVAFNWAEGDRPVNGYVVTNENTVFIGSDSFSETTTVDKEVYYVTTLNYHWGSDASKGSEHTIEGKSFAGEIEVFHENLNKSILVVSILLEEDADTQINYRRISNFEHFFSKIASNESRLVELQFNSGSITMESLLPPDKTNEYFMYNGRSSAPPCPEKILRIILKNTRKVNPEFMANLRKLKSRKDGSSMSNNYKATQPIMAGTTVYKSFN